MSLPRESLPDDLATRHERLLQRIAVPKAPTRLATPAFLESIYERAAEASAEELRPEVVEALAEPLQAPSTTEIASRDVSPALLHMRAVEAPGWIRSRVRNDLVTWKHSRRRATARRRAGFLIAAAALVLISLPLIGGFKTSGTSQSASATRGEGILIERYRVTSPIAPSYSTAAIVESIRAGGERGR